MSITLAGDDHDDDVVSSINTTPLVDVMLVLLIIFLITIPVVVHTVPVELPKESNQARQTKPENIVLSVTADGRTFWNEQPLASNGELLTKLKQIAVVQPQPEVQIRGDGAAHYESVGRIVFACQRAGILKIGFITEPPPRD
jgi:biopolymer transport protein ExbD